MRYVDYAPTLASGVLNNAARINTITARIVPKRVVPVWKHAEKWLLRLDAVIE